MIFCDCNDCEIADNCKYKNNYNRLPREHYPGALSLCPKLSIVRQGEQNAKSNNGIFTGFIPETAST